MARKRSGVRIPVAPPVTGLLAHLEEHLARTEEAAGSNPAGSTNLKSVFLRRAHIALPKHALVPGWRNWQTHLTVNQAPQGLQVRALPQEPALNALSAGAATGQAQRMRQTKHHAPFV